MRTASQHGEEIGIGHAVMQQPSCCCGYSATVCVIALQRIISIALLLQNGTSITLQATGDR